MADGARGIVTIIMKMEIEIATDSAIIMAIGIPEVERGNLAEAVAERCQAQRHGVLIAPLGHPLSVLTLAGNDAWRWRFCPHVICEMLRHDARLTPHDVV